ncbi:MAG: capsular polysaccharide synthesis protein [Arachnia sp.]
MSVPTTQERIDTLLAGVSAQVDRVSYFADTIDLSTARATYQELLELLEPQLPELRSQAGLSPTASLFASQAARYGPRRYAQRPVPTDRVFTYWDAPLETAPPLVRACLAQARRCYPSLRVLDGAGARELIGIPPRIAALLEHDRPAHFSDYVRTRVLAEHGGIWLDATIWLGRPITDELKEDLRAGTIFPRWTRNHIGNWFIASHPGTPLLTLQRLGLDAWWNAHDDLPDYFLYHRIFDVIQELVPEARGQWRATPTLSATKAHLLQLQMMQPWHKRRFERIMKIGPLQKLSYKYDEVPGGSVLEHLLTSTGSATG